MPEATVVVVVVVVVVEAATGRACCMLPSLGSVGIARNLFSLLLSSSETGSWSGGDVGGVFSRMNG